jgi:hypothetical protein
MITLKDKHSDYTVTGELYKKTDDCYAVAVHGVMRLLKMNDWEELRGGTFERRVQKQDAQADCTEKEEA